MPKISCVIDDDKQLFAYKSLREVPVDMESGLAHHRHTRDNRTGHTAHCFALTASGIALAIAFQRDDMGLFDTSVHLLRQYFRQRHSKSLKLCNITCR